VLPGLRLFQVQLMPDRFQVKAQLSSLAFVVPAEAGHPVFATAW
jgi:hypothetical protein